MSEYTPEIARQLEQAELCRAENIALLAENHNLKAQVGHLMVINNTQQQKIGAQDVEIERLRALKEAPTPEYSSTEMASLAGQILADPNTPQYIRSLAASVLTQARNHDETGDDV